MKKTVNIAGHLAPKTWSKFKKWHKLACKNDPLTSEERFIELGGTIPVKNKKKEED